MIQNFQTFQRTLLNNDISGVLHFVEPNFLQTTHNELYYYFMKFGGHFQFVSNFLFKGLNMELLMRPPNQNDETNDTLKKLFIRWFC